jgi:hypothetical protein
LVEAPYEAVLQTFDKDQAFWVKIELRVEPDLSPRGDVGSYDA